jgi:hypothetical protein
MCSVYNFYEIAGSVKQLVNIDFYLFHCAFIVNIDFYLFPCAFIVNIEFYLFHCAFIVNIEFYLFHCAFIVNIEFYLFHCAFTFSHIFIDVTDTNFERKFLGQGNFQNMLIFYINIQYRTAYHSNMTL